MVASLTKLRKKAAKTMKKKLQGKSMEKAEETYVKKSLVEMEKPLEKSIVQIIFDNCQSGYCNPGCKGTVFEDGGEELSNEAKQKIEQPVDADKHLNRKQKKIVKGLALSMSSKMRKSLFQGRKTVLKNDFYYKIPNKTVSEAKQKGALSGCTVAVL